MDFQPALKELLAATGENAADAGAFAYLGDSCRFLGMTPESTAESKAAMDRALALDPDVLDALHR